MTLARAELTGVGVALAFHVALIVALSINLARVANAPEPPSMEVELVDEVGLAASAPTSIATPPPQAQAPELAPVPEPVPQPMPEPVKLAPRIEPRPAPRATTPAKPAPQRPAPQRPQPRASQLGDDFLKGIPNSPSKSTAPARPAAATVSASAMAGIVQAIKRQVQPCADRQVNPGPGASRIRVRLHIQLLPNGRLKRAPDAVSVSGTDDENERYVERVKDLAVATFVGCSPLTGLPPELYKTKSGQGWSDFYLNYNLP